MRKAMSYILFGALSYKFRVGEFWVGIAEIVRTTDNCRNSSQLRRNGALFFEIALVLVRFNYIAGAILNADQRHPKQRLFRCVRQSSAVLPQKIL